MTRLAGAAATICAPIPMTDRPRAGEASAKAERGGRTRAGHAARCWAPVYWGFVLGVWGFVATAGLFAYYASQLPPIDQLAVPKRPPDIAILAVDGSLIANRGDTGGAAVHLSELPPYLPKAFIAIEDRRFYSHFGVDPIGIARAVIRDVTGHGGMEGGSTLTQQLAKNLFLTQERTLSRKFQEAILAVWLERKYSKDQILELYLNRVYFGSGAYGVEAAAQKYFGKSARNVTLSEAAVLAGLMKSPTRLAPNHNLNAANERAAQVITAMAEQGHITEAMAKLALASPAEVVHHEGRGLGQLRRRLRHGHARRHGRRDRPGHCRLDDARSAYAGGGRTRGHRRTRRQRRQISASSKARWSRSIPTARSRRWSAAATTPTANSTAPSPPSASPARPSSRLSILPRWRRA